MQISVRFSEHALCRMAQRNVSPADVKYVLQHGRRYKRAGAIHCFLGKKDIPEDDARDDAIARLEGTTVLVTPTWEKGSVEVITVYRNRSAPRKIRRKVKYFAKRQRDYDVLPLAR